MTRFATQQARALLTGVAAHAVGRLPSLASAAVAMLLGHLAHGSGWPVVGGSARIADALAAAGRLPTAYERALTRYRYGPGAAKADFLVTEPIPWADSTVGQATTVHLGGTQAHMIRTETATAAGIIRSS
ncbi:hypothetical protein K7B06_18355 [Streptomyces erythrochromogenes]|nr:hypothetical protein [Streptomyces erythrochromogenes]